MTDSGPAPASDSTSVEGHAPGEVRTDTWAMWLIAVLPLTGLLRGVPGFVPPIAAPGSSGPALTVSVAFVPLVVGLLLAAADRRILAARGVLRPLHWGWAVIDPVYVIGRSVVVRRRVQGSLAPLWLWLVATLLVTTVNLLRH